MYLSSAASHNQTSTSFKIKKHFQFDALRVLFNKALQALKETTDDCENKFLNVRNFQRFDVNSFKLFSPQ